MCMAKQPKKEFNPHIRFHQFLLLPSSPPYFPPHSYLGVSLPKRFVLRTYAIFLPRL